MVSRRQRARLRPLAHAQALPPERRHAQVVHRQTWAFAAAFLSPGAGTFANSADPDPLLLPDLADHGVLFVEKIGDERVSIECRERWLDKKREAI